MNHFLLAPDERLAHWKDFRKRLPGMPENNQLAAVASYWAQAPASTFAYDVENPEGWPTIWEMIHAGVWCRNSVAIGMAETLRLAGWNPARLVLQYIKEWEIQDIRLITVLDGALVLNYRHGTVEQFPRSKHDVLVTIHYSGRKWAVHPK